MGEEPGLGGGFHEALGGLMGLLVAQAVGAEMHGDEGGRFEFDKRIHGLLGADVVVAAGWIFVGPDGKEGDVGMEAFSDFGEAVKPGGIAGMVEGAALPVEGEAAKAAVPVDDFSGAPVVGGSESDFHAPGFVGIPPGQFVDFFKTQIVDQVADPVGYDDGLFFRHPAQGGPVEVVEVGVGDEDEVDVWEVVEGNADVLEPADDEKPIGPVGVDEDVVFGGLDQKGRMSDPSEADLVAGDFGEEGGGARVHPQFACQERRDEHLRDEVARPPSREGFGLFGNRHSRQDRSGTDKLKTFSARMETRGIHEEKRKVRAEMRGRLAKLTSDERGSWSSAIRKVLAERADDRAVVAFMPLSSEPDITAFLRELWDAGKTVGLPRVEGSELVVHLVVHEEQLVCGSFGLREPSPELPVWQPGRAPALCLVPGVAFDRQGHRLGRGRGYYDRLLSRHAKELETVGVFFGCQHLDAVPREAHDQTLAGWVTEKGFGFPQYT